MDRSILHLDMDTFFVSVERLRRPELMGKPIIIGGWSERAVVSSCSYEARNFGVHSGMPLKVARRLCSDAAVIRGDMEAYSNYSRVVSDIVSSQAPIFEKASIDEFYLDVSGMDRYFGTLKWAQELRGTIIKETGLPISFGLSVNKSVAKVATGQAKPNGALHIPLNEVHPFLDPLSIRKIPMLGDKSFHILRSMGVATIGVLSKMPPVLLKNALGANGLEIWRRANGIDETPVLPYEEAKSISKETTFENDTSDLLFLQRTLSSMVENMAFKLRKKNKLTGCVTLKIRYADFDTHTMQRKIPYSAFDHVLNPLVKDLFSRLYNRRLMIRLLGIRFSELVGGKPQLSLFDDTSEMNSLYTSLDNIRKRYGEQSIVHAQRFFLSRNQRKE